MLIQLLEILKENRLYSLQELFELTDKNIDLLKMEIEYLENNGYIKKIQKRGSYCENNKCDLCKLSTEEGYYWEVL